MKRDTHDPRPCKGENVNVCVAEGCYGEACKTIDDWPGWTGLRVGPSHLDHYGHAGREVGEDNR